jgi:hypothetical protein
VATAQVLLAAAQGGGVITYDGDGDTSVTLHRLDSDAPQTAVDR